MNIGNIVTPNTKGQIVIPQKIRKSLGVDKNTPLQLSLVGKAIILRPIKSVVTSTDTNTAVLEVLKKTAGSWAGDDWPKTEKRQRKIELVAAKKRKSATW